MVTLVPVAPGHALDAPAAAAYKRALAAGCPPGITSSYRTPARQQQLRTAYLVSLKHPPRLPYAAAVEDSEHVTGNALDLPRDPEAWMRAHPDYGFVFTDPTERWHVAYRIARDRHFTFDPPPADLPKREDDDMPGYVTEYPLGARLVFLLSADLTTKRHLHSQDERAALLAAGNVTAAFTAATLDNAAWTPCHDPATGGPVS